MAKTSKVIDIRHGRHLTVIHINDPKERNKPKGVLGCILIMQGWLLTEQPTR